MGRARSLKKSLRWQKPRTARYYNGVWLSSEIGLQIYKVLSGERRREKAVLDKAEDWTCW